MVGAVLGEEGRGKKLRDTNRHEEVGGVLLPWGVFSKEPFERYYEKTN
jgi:hypothetical protein